MSTPMTAEEIRKEWQASAQNPVAVAWLLEWMLDWMSAREREHAELLARVERLEAQVRGGRAMTCDLAFWKEAMAMLMISALGLIAIGISVAVLVNIIREGGR